MHDRFTERINDLERNDKQFYDAVFRKASLLSAPLVEEKVDTLVRQNDGSSKQQEIVIGDRVAAFKAVIETEDEKLKKLWRQWDELQEEYIKLGVEVFGPVKFGGSAAEYRDLEGGYRKDMEYWELEHGVLIEEIGNEVENIGVKVLQKLRNTEKVCWLIVAFVCCEEKLLTNFLSHWTLLRRRNKQDCCNLSWSRSLKDHLEVRYCHCLGRILTSQT